MLTTFMLTTFNRKVVIFTSEIWFKKSGEIDYVILSIVSLKPLFSYLKIMQTFFEISRKRQKYYISQSFKQGPFYNVNMQWYRRRDDVRISINYTAMPMPNTQTMYPIPAALIEGGT